MAKKQIYCNMYCKPVDYGVSATLELSNGYIIVSQGCSSSPSWAKSDLLSSSKIDKLKACGYEIIIDSGAKNTEEEIKEICNILEGKKIIINLVHKYETGLFDYEDWSNGTFLEGTIAVHTEQELDSIVDKFIKEGKIDLYENIGKYIENNLADKITTVDLSKFAYSERVYGNNKGYIDRRSSYSYHYWLDIVNELSS